MTDLLTSDKDPDVTNEDLAATLRLGRQYLWHGEPYAPAVMGVARMLAAYRRELEQKK